MKLAIKLPILCGISVAITLALSTPLAAKEHKHEEEEFGANAVIIEYQVIIDQAEPERDDPWVDGDTRRALINLPGDITEVTVPIELIMPGVHEFEVLAIEASGNSTISEGEFDIEDE